MITLTTAEVRQGFISNYEAELGQSVPVWKKAFIRVLATIEAMIYTTLLKFANERALQAFATTATGSGLDNLGAVYSITRKQAVSAIVVATLGGVEDTLVPAGTAFVARLNGLVYNTVANVYVTGGVAEVKLRCETPGTLGNIDAGAELNIASPIGGVDTSTVVDSTDTTGTDTESDTDYRRRILDRIRAILGGGNAAQYREWAQGVVGVARAYPYTGKPYNLLNLSIPPDRTVYIRAITSINIDGIAPPELLVTARTGIRINPVTNAGREPLGLTSDTLYVESIRRTGFYLTIVSLVTSAGQESTVMGAIEAAADAYFVGMEPFVEAIDSQIDRRDTITDVAISEIVNRTARQYGATAQGVAFGLFEGDSVSKYILGPGELAKLINMRYI